MSVVTLKMLGGAATDQTLIDATQFKRDYRIDDVSDQVVDMQTQSPAFYRLLSLFRKGPNTNGIKYGWFRGDIPQVMTTVTAAATDTATTINVVDSSIFQPGMTVMCQRTGEQFFMSRSAMSSLTAITVATGCRGVLGSGAAAATGYALVPGDVLVAMGVNLAERGTATRINHELPRDRWNYCTLFSTSTEITELQDKMASAMKFGFTFPKQLQTAWFKLNRQVNQHLIHGRRGYLDDASEGRRYFCSGFVEQVETNVMDLSQTNGIITWPMWNAFIENLAQPGPSSMSKTLVCGKALFDAINQIHYLIGRQACPPSFSAELGTMISTVTTKGGISVDLVLDRWSFPGQNSGMGLVVDLNHVEFKQIEGLPFQVRENIQANNSHTREDEIYGSASLKVDCEEVHGVIRGATGAM